MNTLVVPGFIYYECLDPDCTEFPRERPDIPMPTFRKRGFGSQAVYGGLTEEQTQTIIEHISIFGEAISFGTDPECMAVGRRIVRWVEKLSGRAQ